MDRLRRHGQPLRCTRTTSVSPSLSLPAVLFRRYETLVLELKRPPVLPPASALATKVLGRSAYLNWPLMHEAQVVGISDEKEVEWVTKRGTVLRYSV